VKTDIVCENEPVFQRRLRYFYAKMIKVYRYAKELLERTNKFL